MLNRLALVPGSAPERGAYFWEPTVDGMPVRRLLRFADPEDVGLDVLGLGPAGENVPAFVHSWFGPGVGAALALLGEQPAVELDPGRVPLYVCPSCGDMGCGAIGMRVERTASTVTWREFRWETGPGDPDDDLCAVPGGPFVFDRAQHDAEVRRFVDTYDAERAALPATVALHERQPGARRAWWRRWGRG